MHSIIKKSCSHDFMYVKLWSCCISNSLSSHKNMLTETNAECVVTVFTGLVSIEKYLRILDITMGIIIIIVIDLTIHFASIDIIVKR